MSSPELCRQLYRELCRFQWELVAKIGIASGEDVQIDKASNMVSGFMVGIDMCEEKRPYLHIRDRHSAE